MAAYDPNNIFAKILRGDLPCYKIYEDDKALAFLDIMPRAPGHALVLPIATATCDYIENNAIAAMLIAGPMVDAETVDRASFWTQAKSLGGLVTDAIAVIMLVTVFNRWWQRRAQVR